MSARSLILTAALAALASPAAAQHMEHMEHGDMMREALMGQFEASAQKLVALAEAMPADKMTWRPMEGVASVADAYMHIAKYNYEYPEVGMGVEAGLDYEQLEGVVTDKAEVVRILAASMDHVRDAVGGMSDADLHAPARLYGRDTVRWTVLLQLVTHMNEHLGQSIAYARMNEVVPPWSR